MIDPLEELRALRRRLAELEKIAAAQPAEGPPALTDRTPGFGDALRQLARDGTASGSAVDALRAAVEGPGTVPMMGTPDPAQLEAGGSGSSPFDDALRIMRTNQARRNAIETVSPGSSGRVDVLAPAAPGPIDKIRKALEEH